jgi:hypothetical protein
LVSLWEEGVMANGSSIKVVRAIAKSNGNHLTKPILLIRGKPAKAPRAVVALLGRLNDDFGRVVAGNQLAAVVGRRNQPSRRTLIQRMVEARKLLAKHKAGCTITLARRVGYALCKIAR